MMEEDGRIYSRYNQWKLGQAPSKDLCSQWKLPTSKMHPWMGRKLPFTLHNMMAVQRSEICVHNLKKTW